MAAFCLFITLVDYCKNIYFINWAEHKRSFSVQTGKISCTAHWILLSMFSSSTKLPVCEFKCDDRKWQWQSLISQILRLNLHSQIVFGWPRGRRNKSTCFKLMCQTSEETFAHQTRSPDSVTLPFSASSWLPLTPEVKIGAHMLHCVHQRVAYIVWIVCGAVSLNNNNNNKESCLLRPRTTIMRAATNTVKLWAVLKQTNERRRHKTLETRGDNCLGGHYVRFFSHTTKDPMPSAGAASKCPIIKWTVIDVFIQQ